MPALSVFLRSDDPAKVEPRHSCSKTLALLILALPAAKKIVDENGVWHAIQLLSCESLKQVKLRARRIMSTEIIDINPAGYYTPNLLSYPPTGQESDARERQRKLWLTAERF